MYSCVCSAMNTVLLRLYTSFAEFSIICIMVHQQRAKLQIRSNLSGLTSHFKPCRRQVR